MTDDRIQFTRTPAGLSILSERMPDRGSISVGVWLRAGARDEPRAALGITHFLEHMMFKGTETRDARAIAASLESLGGHLDAFTAREQVCYYGRALAEHLGDLVDVLSDLVCRSRFAPADVEKEKSVVREEIFACEDNPDDKVNEMLAAQMWSDHPLGRPILGTVDTVDAFESDGLRAFFRRRFRPEEIIVSAAGGLDHAELCDLVARHLAPPDGEALAPSGPPPPFEPTVRHDPRSDLQQLYLALGTRTVAWEDPQRYPLAVLNTLLGGGMSSRLFQSVREEAGLAYSVYSALDVHRDTGLLTVQLGVAPERAREALALVREELAGLCERGATTDEVVAAQAQLRGNLLIGQESVSNRMYHLAYEEIYGRRYTPAEEQVRRIMAVTPEQVNDAARRYLDPTNFALAALGPAAGGELGERDWAVRRAAA
jgi:predicted Zn-dependent peptidase